MSVGLADALPARELVSLVLMGELPQSLLVRGILVLPLLSSPDAALLLGEAGEASTEDLELLLEVWAALERSEAQELLDDGRADRWAGPLRRGGPLAPRDRIDETPDGPEQP